RRAGVAIPTVYYNFHSLTDIIAEATIVMLNRTLAPFSQLLSDMQGAVVNEDGEKFRCAASEYVGRCWSPEANEDVHRIAPLISHFRQVAPEDVRLRAAQAREVAELIEVLRAAQARGWIRREDDATAFVIVHWTCVLGQAIFWHPAFGALTAIDFPGGVGHLRYQTALRDDIRAMPVKKADTM